MYIASEAKWVEVESSADHEKDMRLIEKDFASVWEIISKIVSSY